MTTARAGNRFVSFWLVRESWFSRIARGAGHRRAHGAMGPVPGAPSGGGAAFTESSLRAMFLALDTSGDGFLSYRELWDGLSGSDVDWDASYDKRVVLDRLWKVADADGNDRVTFPEFWLMVAATRSPTEEELSRAHAIFRALDASGDGVLDRLEIQEGLRNPDVDWALLGFDRDVNDRHVFALADEDGDGRITFEEFWRLILRQISVRERAAVEASANAIALSDAASWDARQVGDWLDAIGHGAYADAFVANGVHGYALLQLSFDALPRLQVRKFDDCRAIMAAIRELRGAEPDAFETHEHARWGKRRFARRAPDELVRRHRFGNRESFERETVRLNEMYAKPQMVVREAV